MRLIKVRKALCAVQGGLWQQLWKHRCPKYFVSLFLSSSGYSESCSRCHVTGVLCRPVGRYFKLGRQDRQNPKVRLVGTITFLPNFRNISLKRKRITLKKYFLQLPALLSMQWAREEWLYSFDQFLPKVREASANPYGLHTYGPVVVRWVKRNSNCSQLSFSFSMDMYVSK